MFGLFSNNGLKKKVIKYFEDTVETASSGRVVEAMQYAAKRLNAVKDVSGGEKKKVLLEIQALQEDLDEAIAGGNLNTVKTVCNQIASRITKLSAPGKKRKKAKIGTAQEVFQQMLANAQDEYRNLQKLHQTAQQSLMADPGNILIQAECESLEMQVSTVLERMNYLKNEALRETTLQAIEKLSQTEKMILATASVTEEEFTAALDKLTKVRENLGARTASTEVGRAAILSGAKTSTATATTQNFSRTQVTPSTINATATATATATAAPEENLKAILKEVDVDAFISTCSKYVTKIDEEIKYYSAYAAKFGEELKRLLEKRKTASAMECISLDTQIESVKTQYDTAKRALKRHAAEKTKAEKRLEIARSLKMESTFSENNLADIIEGYSEFNNNIENIAMVIGDLIKKANEDMESVATAVDVMNAEEILTSPSTSDIGSIDIGAKDDDKFAALERELGLL